MRRADKSSLQRSRVFPLFVLLTTAGVSLAQTQVFQPDDQPRTIRGTVVNSMTGAPISRALVFTPGNRLAMLTDGEGHFEFTLPKVGNKNVSNEIWHREGIQFFGPTVLMARKPGFLENPTRVPVEATPGTEVTVSLLPEALIEGRIVSSDSDAASGINVQLFSRQVQDGRLKWVPAGSARANSNGEFRFAELQPGTYTLMTNELLDNDPVIAFPGGQQYGFPPVYFPGVSENSAAGAIQLTAGQTVQADIPITHQPYFNVEIPVASPDLNTNLNVSVSLQGHASSGYTLGYNAEKHRIEGMLPNGQYLVEATAQNSASAQVNLSVSGAPAQGSSLILLPNSSIPVHVTEEFTTSDWRAEGTWGDGKRSFPMPKLRLELNVRTEAVDDFAPRPGGNLRPPTGPNDDSMILENLAPGRYWLRVDAARGYVASATMGSVDLLHEPFTVAPGSSIPIEIKLRDDNAEIAGTVTGVAPTPPATANSPDRARFWQSAFVYCIPLPDSSGQFLQLSASSDGKFDYQMVAPGTYRLLAFAGAQPNLPYRDPEAMRVYESKGQVVHLAAGQKASVQLQLIASLE